MRRAAWILGGLLVLALGAEGFWRARRALDCEFPAAPGNRFVLYTVGESTPAGEPYGSRIALPRLVSYAFAGAVQGREIHVLNLAESGHSMYPQEHRFDRALACRETSNPGAVLIYSGNNDNGRVEGGGAWAALRVDWLERSKLLKDSFYWAEERFQWARVRGIKNYEARLRGVIENALDAGLTPLLSTVVSNQAGVDPGLQVSQIDVDPAAVARLLDANVDPETVQNGRLADFLRWHRARALLESKDKRAEARDLLRALSDRADGDNFNRATTGQNELLRKLAKEYSVPLVDAVKAFEAASPLGVLDDGLFADGHHPNFKGHRLLAERFALRLGESFGEKPARSLGDEKSVLEAFGYGPGHLAEANVHAGLWLLSASAWHAHPDARLALARLRFEEAARLDDANLRAWMGLALTWMARHKGLLRTQEGIDRVERLVGFYGRGAHELDHNDLRETLDRFADAGCPKTPLDKAWAIYKGATKKKRIEREFVEKWKEKL